MHYHVFKLLVGFYNRVQKQPHTYCHSALIEELVEAVISRSRTGGANAAKLGWGPDFLHTVESLFDVWKDMPTPLRNQRAREQVLWLLSKPLPEAELISAYRKRMMASWAHDRLITPPESFPSDSLHPGLHMSKYKHWMGLSFERAAPPMHPPHAHCFIPFEAHRCLMRFRLCCWPIAANRDHHLPRNARLCPLCNKGVEDERHVLLECEAYTCVRSTYGISSDSMKQVMQGADQFKLACCVRDIWSKRCLLIRQHHDGAHGVQDATNNPVPGDEGPLRLG